MTKIFIGMPVYNGARFISDAIESVRKQTFTDWTLLISDNASEDDTERICKQFCDRDKRITYYRHDKNIDAAANFKFLLDKSDSEYFAWFAADDVWHTDFLKSCISILDNNKNCGMAFCNIVNIDSFGHIIRTYPDFSRMTGSNRLLNVCRFLSDPEILGKANIIYSVYRLDLCRAAWRASPLTHRWGSDMSFVLAALTRSNLLVNDKVLFQKRIAGLHDKIDEVQEIKISNRDYYVFSLKSYLEYFMDNLRVIRGTRFYWVALIVVVCRIPMTIINFLIGLLKYHRRDGD